MPSSPVSYATPSTSSSITQGAGNKERKKNIARFTKLECLTFLEQNWLSSLKEYFVRAGVDGPLLASLIHPDLGDSIMQKLGIDECCQELLIKAIESALNN